jgi:nitrite reductase (NADH) small subunit
MGQWVRLCGVAEAPVEGAVMEIGGVCLARSGGELSALDNWCPHRQGPLGQGWLEGNAVVCPWHSWVFDLKTGAAEFPEGERVKVFPLRVVGEDVLVEIEGQGTKDGSGNSVSGNEKLLDGGFHVI